MKFVLRTLILNFPESIFIVNKINLSLRKKEKKKKKIFEDIYFKILYLRINIEASKLIV